MCIHHSFAIAKNVRLIANRFTPNGSFDCFPLISANIKLCVILYTYHKGTLFKCFNNKIPHSFEIEWNGFFFCLHGNASTFIQRWFDNHPWFIQHCQCITKAQIKVYIYIYRFEMTIFHALNRSITPRFLCAIIIVLIQDLKMNHVFSHSVSHEN